MLYFSIIDFRLKAQPVKPVHMHTEKITTQFIWLQSMNQKG